jgi:hypothetical protein
VKGNPFADFSVSAKPHEKCVASRESQGCEATRELLFALLRFIEFNKVELSAALNRSEDCRGLSAKERSLYRGQIVLNENKTSGSG